MHVKSTVYPVAEARETDDEQWYEYTVALVSDSRRVIDSWNSLYETYNSCPKQRLSKEKAKQAVAEIRSDVEQGDASTWFDTSDD
jgi:hypothetical protein